MKTETIFNLAILEAKAGQQDQLRDALRALVPFTRQEAGCLDYTLFELADKPGTFYMRESFSDQAALDAHFSMPYFKAFEKRFDELLARPLQLVGLKEVP
ncbi:putative monooxygenase YcnE|uniref:putative quinol monooxygenase n=1 Tax=Delftia acidovorans TaxID=80866 RepID=UPI001C0D3BB3|nr:putative quinol monooxygenase [Delftia acidovorans]MCA1067288.1 putative monooxygenase YcnE [Delftia acidovorans]